MINREFDAITKADIDGLVTGAVPEGRTIEYKAELPGGSDEARREFFSDASAFANAAGGDLIYGIREKRDSDANIPEAADGVPPDNAVTRLEEMLRSGIDPRIPGIRIKGIDGFPSGQVIVLRIPKSWASPHMVTFKNSSRFFVRTNSGKAQLDVGEIRAAFLASDSLASRISAFRSDRVGKILIGETPVRMEAKPKVVLHLLPIAAFSGPASVDFQALDAAPNRPPPMGSPRSWAPKFNFDGYLITSEHGAELPCNSYIQFFRNGAIEAVTTRCAEDNSYIFGNRIERECFDAADRLLNEQHQLGIDPPVFLALSIVSAKGHLVVMQSEHWPSQRSHPIDRDALLIPETLLENRESPLIEVLGPIFDTIWQASGVKCSPIQEQARQRAAELKGRGQVA